MEIFISIVIILLVFSGAYFFRRKSDGRGIQQLDESIGQLGEQVDGARKSNQRLRDGIGRAEKRAADIRESNHDAIDGIRDAKEILKRAKKRSKG